MNTTLLLPYVPPWNWQQFHAYFALRCLPDMERVDEHGYRRTLRIGEVQGWFALRHVPEQTALELTVSPSAVALLPILAARVERMFDLNTDTTLIAQHLSLDPQLTALVGRYPGLRIPTAFDPFEQAVRAIVGQQVTVKAAVTIVGRLVKRLGADLADAPPDGPSRLFPTPLAIAEANLDGIGMPGKRVATLQGFARALTDGSLALHANDGVDDLIERLCALPGIGPWTAQYVALRAFGVADAFPASDLGLLKAKLWGRAGISARALTVQAEAWRPWRAYAAMYLWQSYAEPEE
jgi:DNA-3-methyladenine glycosylase II